MICKGVLTLQQPIGEQFRLVAERAKFPFEETDLAEVLEDMIIENEEARYGFNEVVELEDF